MQHHAKSTSPSCKRKIHFLLSPYILSDAVFKELTSENHPHSHQLETAFYFTSLKPPRQQLFLPAASVCSADRGKRWSLHLNKTTVAGFRLNRCQPHRATQPAAYRPAAGRANTPGHGERETRWEMHVWKVRAEQGGRHRHVGRLRESRRSQERHRQTCWDTPERSPYGARGRTPAEARRTRERRACPQATWQGTKNVPTKARRQRQTHRQS